MIIELYRSYNDLCGEIAWLEDQIAFTTKEQEDWWIGGRLFHTVPMENAAARYDKLEEKLVRMRKALRIIRAHKAKVDELILYFDSLEHQIAYLKYCKGKTYQEIADELGYTYQYVRLLHSKMKREYEIYQNV